MIKKVLENQTKIVDLEKQKADLTKENSDLLQEIAKESTSFKLDGKYYNIRSREGKYFMCSSDVPFGSWLKTDEKAESKKKVSKPKEKPSKIVLEEEDDWS